MKNILLLLILFPVLCFSQEEYNNNELTKYEKFASNYGDVVKIIDCTMPNINLKRLSGMLGTCVRKVIRGGESEYYFVVVRNANNGISYEAMIEYSDLVDVNKAIEKMKHESTSDLSLNADYLENKFCTEDYFTIGYYISKGKIEWFVTLDRYKKGSTFPMFDDGINVFKDAQIKIESLLKQDGIQN